MCPDPKLKDKIVTLSNFCHNSQGYSHIIRFLLYKTRVRFRFGVDYSDSDIAHESDDGEAECGRNRIGVWGGTNGNGEGAAAAASASKSSNEVSSDKGFQWSRF